MVRTDLVSLTKRLVSIPSPFGKEHEIAQFVYDYLGNATLQKIDGFGPNVISERIVDDDLPTILLNAHMDTIEVWKGGLEPKLKDKRMYGLGAADMKAGLAIILDVFKNSNMRNLNLTFAGTVDEEGNSLGAYKLLSEKRLGADLCIISEPSDERAILGARGRYVIELELESEGGHGARPLGAHNTVDDAAEIIKALGKLKLRSHPKLGKGSTCALKIEGGGDSLSVPTSCKLRVDRHVVTGESKSMIMKDFKTLVGRVPLRSRIRLKWLERPTPFLEPYITKQTALVKMFIKEHKRLFKTGTGFASSVGDYNLFAKRMPTIVFGPKGDDWHSVNEYVDCESVIRCHHFYNHFLKKLDHEAKKI
jgi:succinyl-diaminopimelate desuccinylase